MSTLRVKARPHAAEELAAATEIDLEAWLGGARPEGPLALVLPNTADVAAIAGDLPRFAAIIVQFPSFRDGRAYSQARLLRERFKFTGEIRARGDILRDQALFMARVGIDAFEIAQGAEPGFREALGEQTYFYQAGADGSGPAFALRAAGRIAA